MSKSRHHHGGTLFQGTSSDDLFFLTSADLKGATVDGGTGTDTLAIADTGDLTFSSRNYLELLGIDVFDFTSHSSGVLAVSIDTSMMSQSDAGLLTVVSGADGIDQLSAPETGQGTLLIDGIGTVALADNIDNAVSIADGATVQVAGGNGNDTITGSSTGSLLDGGGGNDLLVGGNGADSIAFMAGDGSDHVTGFDITQDLVSLTSVQAANFNDLMALVSNDATGAVVDLGNGDQLHLDGVDKWMLGADNFLINGSAPSVPPTIYVDRGISAADLNSLIANAADGSTIVLRDGTYNFDHSITVTRSDITLKGESEAGTILNFDFAAGSEDHGVQVVAGDKSYLSNAVGAIANGATTITLADASGLAAGDALYIEQDNTQSYLDANGWSNIDWTTASTHPFREAIAEVASVDGNTVTLNQPIPYDMDSDQAKVYSIDMLHGVSLSDFTVTYPFGTPNPYDFANTLPAYEGLAGVFLKGTDGANLDHISVIDAPSLGFDIHSSINANADSLHVSGAHDKGPGGNGYGVRIYETSHSHFSNLDLQDGRHAFLFSAWHAENNNTVEIASTNRDINFHGSPDTGNVVTVANSVLDYDPSQNTGPDDGYWSIVSDGGTSHALTDIYGGNAVKFVHAEGYDRGETIYGADGGAYLNGKGGQDTIIGGAGDDTLVGGDNKDTLTGHAGADTFVFYLGTNYDHVTDFQLGPGGDTLVFAGNPAVTSFSDLQLTQNGSDAYIKFGGNSTVILEGHDISELNGNNMIFDPDGHVWAPVYFGSDFIA